MMGFIEYYACVNELNNVDNMLHDEEGEHREHEDLNIVHIWLEFL